jgi:hypothetical protein
VNHYFRILIIFTSLTFILPSRAADLLLNPREVEVQHLIREQSPTLVIADDVNVRNLPTTMGNGGFVFAKLQERDEVFVISCEGFGEGDYWIRVYIPELKEFGYVASQYLQSNFNHICERSNNFYEYEYVPPPGYGNG